MKTSAGFMLMTVLHKRIMSPETIRGFIARWAAASVSEQAYSQLFLAELSDVLVLSQHGKPIAEPLK
jgi:hypothetical protein